MTPFRMSLLMAMLLGPAARVAAALEPFQPAGEAEVLIGGQQLANEARLRTPVVGFRVPVRRVCVKRDAGGDCLESLNTFEVAGEFRSGREPGFERLTVWLFRARIAPAAAGAVWSTRCAGGIGGITVEDQPLGLGAYSRASLLGLDCDLIFDAMEAGRLRVFIGAGGEGLGTPAIFFGAGRLDGSRLAAEKDLLGVTIAGEARAGVEALDRVRLAGYAARDVLLSGQEGTGSYLRQRLGTALGVRFPGAVALEGRWELESHEAGNRPAPPDAQPTDRRGGPAREEFGRVAIRLTAPARLFEK